MLLRTLLQFNRAIAKLASRRIAHEVATSYQLRVPRIIKSVRRRKNIRAAFVALTIAMTAFSPIASALQIVLGTAMKVRTLDDSSLTAVGILAAGSVVEVPDQFKVMKNGKVDADATFNNWLANAGFAKKEIQRKITNPRKDFYYPVRIVSAKGTHAKGLKGKTLFMALRVLERSRGGMTVKEDAPIYKATKTIAPLNGANYGRPAPKARSAEATKSAPAVVVKPAPAKDSTTPTHIEPAPAPAKKPADQGNDAKNDSATEAAAGGEDCPTCGADKARASQDKTAGLARSVLPQAYNNEARGMQGLTSRFDSSCSAFIKADGTYGPWGQIVLKEIMNSKSAGNRTSDFMANWDMNNAYAQKACPNFNSFSDEQKRHFWVYAVAALAMEEATCNPDAEASLSINQNGHAEGLMQIEERDSLRQSRDITYGGHYCAGDNPNDVNLNLRCGVHMVDDVVQLHHGPYDPDAASVYGNYHSSFKFSGTLARSLISEYKDCGAKYAPVVARHKHRKSRHKTRRRKA